MAEANMEIIGQSEAICSLSAMLPKIARSDAPAFLTRSTGTGKEHFARMLHRMSGRCERPFIAINCTAIPDTLFESELFGFEKGSFTGAQQARKGKAVLADGGTLFLDEICELSPFSQSKLLRVLEEKEVYPIGADRPVHVDLRLIAATNLTRSVELQFRTNQVPLDRIASENTVERLRLNMLNPEREMEINRQTDEARLKARGELATARASRSAPSVAPNPVAAAPSAPAPVRS